MGETTERDDAPAVWVVCRDYGYEGRQAATAAFLTATEADGYAAHMSESGMSSHVVDRVPLMRFAPARITPADTPALVPDQGRPAAEERG